MIPNRSRKRTGLEQSNMAKTKATTNNRIWLIGGLLATILVIAGIALANPRIDRDNEQFQGMMGNTGKGMMGSGSGMGTMMRCNMSGMMQMMQYHEQVHKILEEGTYADLIALRQQTSLHLMPMVQNVEQFKLMQLHHEEMEQMHESGNISGMGAGGCPMMG